MPEIICNTSPLQYLYQLGVLPLLPQLAKTITIPPVRAKKEAAVKWCEQASAHAATCGGKLWKYALIPHDAIAENMTLAGLVGQFGASK